MLLISSIFNGDIREALKELFSSSEFRRFVPGGMSWQKKKDRRIET